MREIEEIWREPASHALAIAARAYLKGSQSRELVRRNLNQEVASNIGSENRTVEQDVVGHEGSVFCDAKLSAYSRLASSLSAAVGFLCFFRDSEIADFAYLIHP